MRGLLWGAMVGILVAAQAAMRPGPAPAQTEEGPLASAVSPPPAGASFVDTLSHVAEAAGLNLVANVSAAPASIHPPNGALSAWDWLARLANAANTSISALRKDTVVLSEPAWVGREGDYGTGWGVTSATDRPQLYQVRRDPATLSAFTAALRSSSPEAVAALLDGAEVPLSQLGAADSGGLAAVVEGLCAGSGEDSRGTDRRRATTVLRRVPWTMTWRYVWQLAHGLRGGVVAPEPDRSTTAVSLSTRAAQPLKEVLASLSTDEARLTCDPRVARSELFVRFHATPLPLAMEALASAVGSTVRLVGNTRHISPGMPDPVMEEAGRAGKMGRAFALVYPDSELRDGVGDRIPIDEVFPGIEIECRSGDERVILMALEVDAECGLSCGLRSLVALARMVGQPIGAEQVRELGRKYPQSNLSMLELQDAAAETGLKLEGVRADLPELLELKCPAIIHLKTSHFVVFAGPPVGDKVTVIDEGRSIRVGLEGLREEFSGAALVPAGSGP